MVKTLGIGSRGEDVSKAQEELNRALKKLAEEGKISKSDAIPLAVDGKFGEDTAEAVKTFQKAMKLNKVDKLIGSETQAALSGDVKTAKNLLNESSLTVNMDSVGKTFQKYPGSNIAKGTFKNPSPLEKALMEVEGFNERPKNDGLSKYSDFAHGVPSEKFKNYSKDGKPISKAVAFTALQDQIQFKITQLHERGLDKGFNQMSELQQTAFGHFAYNIDVSKYENKTLGKELKDGNIDKVDDYMKAYNKYTLASRRTFESTLYNSAEEGFKFLKEWKNIDKGSRDSKMIDEFVQHFSKHSSASVKPHDLEHSKTASTQHSQSHRHT